MKCAGTLAIALAFATTLAPCFASVITPTQAHSHDHVLERLNTITRQASCDSKRDCADKESCLTRDGECETSTCGGFCLEVIRCSCSDPCDDEGTCITLGESDGLFLNICIPNFFIDALGDLAPEGIPCDNGSDDSEDESSTEEPNGEDEDGEDSEPGTGTEEEAGDPVCIGVDLLEGFASHQLVFEKHTLARVLCDPWNSCATKGHMVHYREKVMMMGTYCSIVGCERKVMKVNSPKYERGLKVASRTADLHFKAFAARYGTKAEEAVLAAAVRIGL